MRRSYLVLALAGSALVIAACSGTGGGSGAMPRAQGFSGMSFFLTSRNPGFGGNLGGLAGADAHCKALATSVGAGDRTWRAYLSSNAPAVNARDRIGRGPWYNARGQMIAANVDDLHGSNRLNRETALSERGDRINGRENLENLHDVLTGSSPDGRRVPGPGDTTCNNWTSAEVGSAIVGHHDRVGLRDDAASRSWNSSHGTRGCSMELLKLTGGGGLMYCFAVN